MELCELEAILIYIVPSWPGQGESISKKKKKAIFLKSPNCTIVTSEAKY